MPLNIESASESANPLPESNPQRPDNYEISLLEEKDICPNCRSLTRDGAIVCHNCGMLLAISEKTQQITQGMQEMLERKRRVGEALVGDIRPICFIINGLAIAIPRQECVTVGRAGNKADDPVPDVDLSHFQAHQRGISRQHISLSRSHDLVYVKDLNSMNGTFLNGFRLIPNQPRLLRDGDELMLARLITTVRFSAF
jgi:hypothetical protein